MTFRVRLLVIFLLAVLLPMIAFALFVRAEMSKRLTAQYERRVESLVEVIEEDLVQEGDAIAASLAALRKVVVEDNRFRRAAVDRAPNERRYLLDYAGEAMRLTGLSMLQIQDETGRIISSGHFRNEYDRIERELPRWLASLGRTALVQARAPDAPFLALARVDSFFMGNRRFEVVAGREVEQRFLARLARDTEMTVELAYPGGTLTSGAGPHRGQSETETTGGPGEENAIIRELTVPFFDSKKGELADARFRVIHQLGGLNILRRSIDMWFLVAVAAAGVFAVLLVVWLTSRISRPLVELADKTSRIDLDRLDIDFKTSRKDEIGALSRLLGAMTERLRASAVRIKDAERRATLGELARQVNHDIKNGLTPIRNVFRHLVQISRENPEQLPGVFRERQNTLDSSVSYLEDLASSYARLSPRSSPDGHQRCRVNDIVRQVVGDLQSSSLTVGLQAKLGDGAVVLGDPVSLRRILENLVSNAIDSLESKQGYVVAATELIAGEGDRRVVRITVTDTGRGMSTEQKGRVFDDFYTTKENGTGLGLSIVRRLVSDLDGSIRVESEEGKGSHFTVELPVAEDEKQ